MSAGDSLHVRRVDGDPTLWVVTDQAVAPAALAAWSDGARRLFDSEIDVASLSVVSAADSSWSRDFTPLLQATHAALPVCFINGRIADLIGFSGTSARAHLVACLQAASRRNLRHLWLLDPAAPVPQVALSPPSVVPAIVGPAAERADDRGIALGIDASWLLGGESGAQVCVTALLKEVAKHPRILRIVMLSDSGGIPHALRGHAKITGVSWADALSTDRPTLDILHRPYQPGDDVSMERYRRIANCVVITVLDFIAYDNAAYHESDDHWFEYRAAFDRRLCLADQVVAISGTIAARVQRQFAHRLAQPVQAILLGTDHLSTAAIDPPRQSADPSGPYALVLGNDFAHKNRDFAVRVFAEMAARGYPGRLVLAGYHLDLGSSFAYELDAATSVRDRIERVGAVSSSQKLQLLRNADVVLYPTSCEGFGLVPFEAAAVGTPCAFVRFGSLKEMMPHVRAAEQWAVGPFTDLVCGLLADPVAQVQQIRSAGATLTWARAADETVALYGRVIADAAPWAVYRPVVIPEPPWSSTVARGVRHQVRRVTRKFRRLVSPSA